MKDTIISMLLENTGKHPMDSGGANGRRWQRNQFRDFESEEPITFEVNINYNEDGTVRYRDIIPTITLYHWLMGANIEEDERAEEFNALIDSADPWCDDLAFTTEQWELVARPLFCIMYEVSTTGKDLAHAVKNMGDDVKD